LNTALSPMQNNTFDIPASMSGQISLNRRQKAAIIVRLAMSAESELNLTNLPVELQQELTMQMSTMHSVTTEIVQQVVDEFLAEVESIGLSFSGGLEGALNVLDGSINAQVAERLRKEGGVKRSGDPWEIISGMEADRLLPLFESESIEVAAVLLSKLHVSRAAEVLGMLPGSHARRIIFAVSQTGAVTPDAVDRIGQSLAAQLDNAPVSAFEEGPVERVGAILNFSAANTRDEVLAGLDEDDKTFANQVRQAIFTFANIPVRIDPRDIPKITRGIDQAELVTALAYAASGDMAKSSEFILENISKRMADGLRDEISEMGPIKDADGEAAMGKVVAEIRELEAAGEVLFVAQDEAE